MRALLTAIAIAFTGFSVACSESVSPAAPTAVSPRSAALTVSGPAETSAHVAVPFKGRLDGVFSLTFPSPGILAVTGKGGGNATQLGQFTFDYNELVDLSTSTGVGTYVFTAANGDMLTADWTGTGFPTADPNVISIVENATITGGTGRFASASGSFRIERLFNFLTNSGAGSFDGTILR
jgi:hypothetical protein